MESNTRRINTTVFPDPLFIGFDKMFDKLASATPGQTNNYPPYNIVKIEDHKYELQLAIAGFRINELDIELKDGVLHIEGKKEVEEAKNYLHKGISARAFRRAFTLADTIVVKGADLADGILTINLENIIPEDKKPRKILIGHNTHSKEELGLLTE
jgi:molecular chaperone IbpA